MTTLPKLKFKNNHFTKNLNFNERGTILKSSESRANESQDDGRTYQRIRRRKLRKCSSDFKISNRNEICNGLMVRESFGNKIQSNCIYIIL